MLFRIAVAVIFAGIATSAAAIPPYTNLHRQSSTTSKGSTFEIGFDGTSRSSRYDLGDSQTYRLGDQFFYQLADAKSDNEKASQKLSKTDLEVEWHGSISTEGWHSQNSKGYFAYIDEGTASTSLELTIELDQETPFSIRWASKGEVQRAGFQNLETFAAATLKLLTGDTEVLSIAHDMDNLNKTSLQEVTLAAGTYKLIADVRGASMGNNERLPPYSDTIFAKAQASLTFAPVPEPPAALLASSAGLLMALRRRKLLWHRTAVSNSRRSA
jgi:hypothetical protein